MAKELKDFNDTLQNLKEYGVGADTIASAVDIPIDDIRKLMSKEITTFPHKTKYQTITRFYFVLSVMTAFDISAEERLTAVLQHLQEKNHLSLNSISKYANISEECIEKFLSAQDTVSDFEKYKIAYTCLLLFYVLNPVPDGKSDVVLKS